MLKVLELFAGIGACSKALTNLGVKHEIVDAVEIDKFAIKSFNAVHGTSFEPQDITEWNKAIEADLIMHGSPCQDFSFAGLGKGGDKGSGTRSSLMYESLRIIDKLKPKYVIWENVKAVLSKKHIHNFQNYLNQMVEFGYENYYQVLNAKDYGVPQNRERVFTVSIRSDLARSFTFPEKQPLTVRLKDILEKEVDESYYLSDEKIAKMKFKTERMPSSPKCVQVGNLDIKGHDAIKRVYSPDGISPTLTTMGGGNREPKIVAMRGRNPDNSSDRTAGSHTEQRLEANNKGVSNTLTSVQKDNLVLEPKLPGAYGRNFGSRGKIENTESVANTLQAAMGGGGGNVPLVKENVIVGSTQAHAAVVYDGICPTLTKAMGDGGGQVPMHNYDYRIRKLTPKECWRLMGFGDDDYQKASQANSNSQLYKQAGNSIVVNVLEAVLRNLLREEPEVKSMKNIQETELE